MQHLRGKVLYLYMKLMIRYVYLTVTRGTGLNPRQEPSLAWAKLKMYITKLKYTFTHLTVQPSVQAICVHSSISRKSTGRV